MKKKKSLVILALSLLLITGCSVSKGSEEDQVPQKSPMVVSVDNTSQDTIERLEEKIKEQKELIATLENLNTEYFKFIDVSLDYLDEEQLKKLSQSQYKYTLTINGMVIEEGGALVLIKGPVEIIVKSEMLSQLSLPQNLYELGALSGYVDEHISFKDEEPENLVVTDGTIVQAYTYTFGEDDPIEGLEVHLSEEIRERLGFDSDVIEIKITN